MRNIADILITAFLVSCGFATHAVLARMREHKFHAADDTQFRVSDFDELRDNTVRAPRPTLKWALKL
jgi:hypothetical protein